MSTFKQLRDAWDEWSQAALPQIQTMWANDPGPLAMKLPVVLELDGPTSLSNTNSFDYIGYTNTTDSVQGELRALRAASMFLRATSRDNISHPAELTIERARAALRRPDLRAILSDADCAILSVGTTVRYPVTTSGRKELVSAVEVRINWRWDDEEEMLVVPDAGVIEIAEVTPTIDDTTGEMWVI